MTLACPPARLVFLIRCLPGGLSSTGRDEKPVYEYGEQGYLYMVGKQTSRQG